MVVIFSPCHVIGKCFKNNHGCANYFSKKKFSHHTNDEQEFKENTVRILTVLFGIVDVGSELSASRTCESLDRGWTGHSLGAQARHCE
jgi:hypothetical protein